MQSDGGCREIYFATDQFLCLLLSFDVIETYEAAFGAASANRCHEERYRETFVVYHHALSFVEQYINILHIEDNAHFAVHAVCFYYFSY